jgi:hypothetical protein
MQPATKEFCPYFHEQQFENVKKSNIIESATWESENVRFTAICRVAFQNQPFN